MCTHPPAIPCMCPPAVFFLMLVHASVHGAYRVPCPASVWVRSVLGKASSPAESVSCCVRARERQVGHLASATRTATKEGRGRHRDADGARGAVMCGCRRSRRGGATPWGARMVEGWCAALWLGVERHSSPPSVWQVSGASSVEDPHDVRKKGGQLCRGSPCGCRPIFCLESAWRSLGAKIGSQIRLGPRPRAPSHQKCP